MLVGSRIRKAVVTIATDKYFDLWQAHCHENWRRWAERRGWQWFVVKRPISSPAELKTRTVHWDKCRIMGLPELKSYDIVAWVDADIVINPEAPCLTHRWDDQKIAVLSFDDIPDFAVRNHRITEVRGRRNPARKEIYISSELWYRDSGYREFPAKHLNTGVLVMRRSAHHAFMEHVFHKYHRNMTGWEQTPLSWEILMAGLHHPLDYRFNTLWELEWPYHYPFLEQPAFASSAIYGECVRACFANTWFLHFNAADKQHMRHLDQLWAVKPAQQA